MTLTRPVEIDYDEVLRYLKSKGDQTLISDIAAVRGELSRVISPAAAAVCFPLEWREGSLFCGELELPGKSIAEHFKGCDSCIALAVTLGFEADRMISTLGFTDPYRALIADACATAAVEDLADMMTLSAREIFGEGKRITYRFSPGYGDLPLALQPKLLALVDARRMLGLSVSNSMLLSPIKSVTAFIGLQQGECKDNLVRHDCRSCFMKNRCQFSEFNK